MGKARKTALTGVIIVVAILVLLILNKKVKDSVVSQEMLPPVADSASYVEMEDGDTLTVVIEPDEDITMDELRLLVVNTSVSGEGVLDLTLLDETGVLWESSLFEESMKTGSWIGVEMGLVLKGGGKYTLSMEANGFEPYFVQTSTDEIYTSLGFKEAVFINGKAAGSGISLGFSKARAKELTLGDIFYHSRLLVVVLSLVAILLIYVPPTRAMTYLRYVAYNKKNELIANDILLIGLFIVMSIYIYYKGYVDSIYITADSAGYLREAVSMAGGNGFSYDALAGYKSWFANWPILYPAMIALVMVMTGKEAYLASKIVSIVFVGLILLVLRNTFKEKAWMYSLALVNTGFITIAYTTWSELPFMFFMLCYGIVLTRALKSRELVKRDYILLAAILIAAEFTRYFGIFLIAVTGLFILSCGYAFYRKRDILSRNKCIGLTLVAASGAVSYLIYMMINKMMNGMASGVSRRMWWDDYETLTNDLVSSLITEVFNVFCVSEPGYIAVLSISMKALCIIGLVVVLAVVAVQCCKKDSIEAVFFTMAAVYYGMFIVIRYFSSMDTFYFRFFEPATFVLTIALIGILDWKLSKRTALFIRILMTVIVLSSGITFLSGGYLTKEPYYNVVTRQWDKLYSEIPGKSVVIFNDIDYRSEYYRADVLGGTIDPSDTVETIKGRYYGSDYLCIKAEFAQKMVDEGDYNTEVKEMLSTGLDAVKPGCEYLTIALK